MKTTGRDGAERAARGAGAFGLHHAAAGRFVDAGAENVLAYLPRSPWVAGLLAGALAQTGEAGRSRALLDAMPGHSNDGSIAHTFYHFVLGEIDLAVARPAQRLNSGTSC